jgi:lysophospholipase L1-like esterase
MVVCVVAALCVLGYGGYRVIRHSAFPHRGVALPVFTSRCVEKLVPYPIPRHPIVTFGDSITEGYGATNKYLPRELRTILPGPLHLVHTGDTSYPGDLARLLRQPVLNYGVGGETTRDGLPRLQRLLHAVHPSTVVLLEGWNDLNAEQKPSAVTDQLLRMATLIRQSGARPILLTVLPNEGPRWRSLAVPPTSFNALLRRQANAARITLIDSHGEFAAHRPLSAFFRHSDGREDGLHPNDTGYRVLTVLVYQALGHA